MAIEEIVDQLGTETTRRTIVKTGIKLAYAAPLVAATMKLSAGGVAAISGVAICTLTDLTCTSGVDVCPGGNCYCRPSTEGTTFCGSGIGCGAFGYCNTSADCDPDEHCALNTCCGRDPGSACCPLTGGMCIPNCGPSDADINVALGPNTTPPA